MNKLLKMFRFSSLRDRLSVLGYELTFKNLMLFSLGFSFAMFIVGYLLYLKVIYIMILIFIFLVCFPFLMVFKFKADFEKRRFQDIIKYMEQLIYAFNKSNKIRESLVDVYSVTTGVIKDKCKDMIDCIDFDNSTSDLYEKAFSIIEKSYNCNRLKLLHSYLIEVENSGGKSAHSLNILLTDLRNWTSRVMEYQQERRAIQSKVTLSILLALFSVGLMLNLIPIEYRSEMVAMNGYQWGTLVVLVGCIMIYYLGASRVCKSYLDNELDKHTENRFKKCAEYVAKYESKDHRIPRIIKTIIVLGGIGCLIYFKMYIGILPIAVAGIYLILGDMLKKISCVKQITKEIMKMFPNWIRSLILYLQTENVQVAIQKSYKGSPEVLKPEVFKLIEGLDDEPDSAIPYSDFLSAYDVPSLKLSVSYLYSISQFGKEDMLAQLDYLIEQSSVLSINEEKLRNEDALAGFGMLGLAPMLLASVKLALDMTLFLNIILGMMSSYAVL